MAGHRLLDASSILIIGYGREGQSALRFFRRFAPGVRIGVADRKELSVKEFPELEGASLHTGSGYARASSSYGAVIRSPGIHPSTVHLASGALLTSGTELFFDLFPGTVIGVTGTKGKSTTASLIRTVLARGGVPAMLAGNIGVPALDLLREADERSVAVYELSSFQLMGLRRSPHIAVLLNIYPEHLDYHASLQEYREAKGTIAKYQTARDMLIYNEEDPEVRRIAESSRARQIPFIPDSSDLLSQDEKRWLAPIEPAVLVAEHYGMRRDAIREALLSFRPLPHRLEEAGEWKGIRFIDDSQSTHPQTAIRAIQRFGERIGTIILGGSDKGVSFKDLGSEVVRARIPFVVLFPPTGREILREMERAAEQGAGSVPPHALAGSMEEAVRLCYDKTPPGRICLLSPASASFSMFRNYEDRGNQFQLHARRIGEA